LRFVTNFAKDYIRKSVQSLFYSTLFFRTVTSSDYARIYPTNKTSR